MANIEVVGYRDLFNKFEAYIKM